MNHTFKCPHCTAPLNYDDASGKLAIKCDHCGMSTAVPESLRAPATQGVRGLSDTVMVQIGGMMRNGQAINAIKLIRESTGLGLKEAKDIYDALRGGDVDLLNRLLAAEDAAGRTTRASTMSTSSSFGTTTTTTVVIDGSRVGGGGRSGGAGAGAGCGITVAIIGVAIAVAFSLGGLSLVRNLGSLSTLFGGETPPRVSDVVNEVVKQVKPPFERMAILKDSSALVGGDDETQPNVVAHGFSNGSTDQYHLYYLDTLSQTLRWTANAGRQVRVSVSGDTVYMSEQSRLAAIDLASGATRWESSLSDQVALSCDTCIQATADRVYVLANDAELQAFERDSGRKVWSQRLSTVQPRIQVWDKYVVVVERNEKAKRLPAMVRVLNSAGEEQSRFDLVCQASGLASGYDMTASPDSPMYLDAANGMLYSIYGDSGVCVEKRDLNTGGLVWSSLAKADLPNSRQTSLMLHGNTLLAGGYNALIAVDAESGAVRTVLPPQEDYSDLTLIDERSGVAFVSVTRTRGTRRGEIWAIDVASGERLWDLKFEGDGGQIRPDGYTGLLSSGDDETAWTVHVTDAGLRVLRLTGMGGFKFETELLGLRDGVSAGKKSVPLKGSYTLLSPGLFGWRGDVAWLSLSSDVVAIDAAKGEQIFSTQAR